MRIYLTFKAFDDDWNGIMEELRSCNWNEEMKGNVIESWAFFKGRLLDLQQKYVLKARVQSSQVKSSQVAFNKNVTSAHLYNKKM